MYAVIHGGIDKELRTLSCEVLTKMAFDGFAIGGSVGKNREEMISMLDHTVPLLPKEIPNHLLGIGDLPSVDAIVKLGIDTFDSSYPTRSARHGALLIGDYTTPPLKILKTKYKDHHEPIDRLCECYTCLNYTASYIHHLFKAKELVGFTLATIHNLHFMIKLMKDYQQAILNNEI